MRSLKPQILFGKFGQGVIWNLASLVILGVGGIAINSVILRFRGAETLGVFNQVYAAYVVLSQIGVCGVQFSVLKHVSYSQDNLDECARISTSALILIALISGGVGILGFSLADLVGRLLESPEVSLGVKLAMPGLLFFCLNKVLLMVLNGMRHMRAYAVFKSMRYVLIPASILAIILADLASPYLALSLTIAEGFLFFGLVVYVTMKLFRLSVPSNAGYWLLKHLTFGLKGVLSGVLVELDTRIDVLMLGYFSSDAVVGVYSFAAILAEGVAQIPLVIRQNLDPVIGRYFAEERLSEINTLVRRVKLVSFAMMLVLGVIAVFLYPVFFRFVRADGFLVQSWIVFAVIMVGVILSSGYRPFVGIMLQGGRPEMYTLFVAILVVSNVVLNAILISALGIYGAAVVNAALYTLESVLLVGFARRLFGVQI